MRTDSTGYVRATRLAVLLLFTALTGCGSNPSGVSSSSVSSVVINSSRSSIAVGQTLQLSAVALNSSGVPVVGATYDWTSSNTSVATISAQGVVKGIAVGVSTIRAASSGVSGTLEVTVDAGGVTNLVPI